MLRSYTRVVIGFAFLVSVASPVSGQPWPPTAASACETALQWIADNNKLGPDSYFVDDVSTIIKEEIEDGMDLNFFIGRDNLKSGSYQLLTIFNKRVIVFDLTEQQAAARELTPSGVTTARFESRANPADKQSFELSNLVVQSADSIGSRDKIIGQVHCKAISDVDARDYALRISYRTDKTVFQFHYLDTTPDQNGQAISFEFNSITEKEDKQPFTGPVALLFDVVHVDKAGDDYEVYFHSNLVGQMVSIADE